MNSLPDAYSASGSWDTHPFPGVTTVRRAVRSDVRHMNDVPYAPIYQERPMSTRRSGSTQQFDNPRSRVPACEDSPARASLRDKIGPGRAAAIRRVVGGLSPRVSTGNGTEKESRLRLVHPGDRPPPPLPGEAMLAIG